MNWLTRTTAHLRAADKRRRDAGHLAALPDYLLRDIGLTPGGEISLSRQLRGGDK
jgi:uncharacterized protein YjiS (DUF1127 family)